MREESCANKLLSSLSNTPIALTKLKSHYPRRAGTDWIVGEAFGQNRNGLDGQELRRHVPGGTLFNRQLVV